MDRNSAHIIQPSILRISWVPILRKSKPDWVYSLEPAKDASMLCSRCQFRLEMQLLGKNGAYFGTFLLFRDLRRSPMETFTLKRVESLRRSMISAFERLEREEAR